MLNSQNQEVTHCCKEPSKADDGMAGHAIDYCEDDTEGKMWAGNGEYESQVNFCPICGKKATVQIEQ